MLVVFPRPHDTGGNISLRLQTRQNRAQGHNNGKLVLRGAGFHRVEMERGCHSHANVPMSDKIVVFAELRQADVDKSDWQKYGEISSFDTYVSTILGAIGALDECILHRTTVKSGFLGKTFANSREMP